MSDNVDQGGLDDDQGAWVRSSRRRRLVASTPRMWQYFWVDFPHDAYPPEFVGEHPGIIVRAARHLSDTCIIVPVTSTAQAAAHVHELGRNPNPLCPTTPAWAVCNHLYTVHLARLRPCRGKYGNNVYPKVDERDRDGIAAAIRSAIPLLGTER